MLLRSIHRRCADFRAAHRLVLDTVNNLLVFTSYYSPDKHIRRVFTEREGSRLQIRRLEMADFAVATLKFYNGGVESLVGLCGLWPRDAGGIIAVKNSGDSRPVREEKC